MTTVSQIITDAYQYNNLIAINAIPTADEQAKGLRYLNRIFRNIFGTELGELFQTLWLGEKPIIPEKCDEIREPIQYLSSPYVMAPNSRLVLNLSGAATVYFPPNPQDGCRVAIQDCLGNLETYNVTLKGNGRKIGTSSTIILNTNNTNSEWFYRADVGVWMQVSDLTLTDTFPLPSEFEEYFITMLGLRLGASEDVDLSPQLQFVLKDSLKKLKLRYKQKNQVRTELGILRMIRRSGVSNFTGA